MLLHLCVILFTGGGRVVGGRVGFPAFTTSHMTSIKWGVPTGESASRGLPTGGSAFRGICIHRGLPTGGATHRGI